MPNVLAKTLRRVLVGTPANEADVVPEPSVGDLVVGDLNDHMRLDLTPGLEPLLLKHPHCRRRAVDEAWAARQSLQDGFNRFPAANGRRRSDVVEGLRFVHPEEEAALCEAADDALARAAPPDLRGDQAPT